MKSFLLNCVLMLGSITSCFLVLEFATRHIDLPSNASQGAPKTNIGWQQDDYFFLHEKQNFLNGYTLQPNKKLMHQDQNGEFKYWIFTSRKNDLGYRVVQEQPQASNCSTEIWNFGDSFTFGFGLSYEKTYSHLLSQPSTCSLNFGIPGTTFTQSFKVFQHHYTRSKNKPKWATLAIFLGNDFKELSALKPQPLQAQATTEAPSPWRSPFDSAGFPIKNYQLLPKFFRLLESQLKTHSAFYNFLEPWLKNLDSKTDLYRRYGLIGNATHIDPSALTQADPRLQSWSYLESLLAEIEKLPFQSYQTKFIVMLFPSKEMVLSAQANPPQRPAINAIATEIQKRLSGKRIATIDFFPLCYKNSPHCFFKKDNHFNEKGHQLVAKTLRAKILHENF